MLHFAVSWNTIASISAYDLGLKHVLSQMSSDFSVGREYDCHTAIISPKQIRIIFIEKRQSPMEKISKDNSDSSPNSNWITSFPSELSDCDYLDKA